MEQGPPQMTTPGGAAPGNDDDSSGTPARGRELSDQGRSTMQKLRDAGVQVFADRGYHATRVDDIVSVANTSHGTFYLYFSNKEDLFGALVTDVAERLATITDALDPITNDDRGRLVLRSWINEFADVYDRYGTIIQIWTDAENDDTAVGAIGAQVLGGIAQALADQVEVRAGGLSDDAVARQVAATAVVAMVERFNYFVHSGQVDAEREAIVDTLAAVTHAGLFGT